MATFPESLLIDLNSDARPGPPLSLFESSVVRNYGIICQEAYIMIHEAAVSPPAGRDNAGRHFPCAFRSRADRHLCEYRLFRVSAELRRAGANQRPDDSKIDFIATFQCASRGRAHPVGAPGRGSEKSLALRRTRAALSRADPLDSERL